MNYSINIGTSSSPDATQNEESEANTTTSAETEANSATSGTGETLVILDWPKASQSHHPYNYNMDAILN